MYPDDDRAYVSQPDGDSDEARIWVKIDAPDGAGGKGTDDDANTDIAEVTITFELKQPDPPDLALESPRMGTNSKVNVPVGEQVRFRVDASGSPPGGHGELEYYWLESPTEPEVHQDFGRWTSGPDKNLSFLDVGESTVYAKVVFKKRDGEVRNDDMVISEILTIPVRVWDRPTVKDTPPQDRIDAGDVSWYDGKYVGVTGQPVRLMAAGTTSGQGEAIEEVLWDLDGDWGTVERRQPADQVVSYVWDSSLQNAQIRCRAVTNHGIESHGESEAGKTLNLTIYDPVEVDARTGPGDSYTGRVSSAVSLAGAIVSEPPGATVEYQWRVNASTPEPVLKSDWGSSEDMHKGEHIELTPAQMSRNGQMEYADLSLSDSWSVTGEFWTGDGSGADAFYIYVWANQTPTSESEDQGQYSIVFDEQSDDIQLWRGPDLLEQLAQPMAIDNREWRPFRVVFEEGRFEVYLDNQLRLEYDDGPNYEGLLRNSRHNTGNDLCGFGARTGGRHNIHRVRRVAWTAGTPVETTADGEAEHVWTADGTYRAALTATVTTAEGLVLEGTESTEVIVEAGRPTAVPGGPYRGGIAGGDHSPIQFAGNHPDFVEAEDVGKIDEWMWLFSDATNGALELDGQDDHVIVNPMGDFPSAAITAEFWMRTSDELRTGTPLSYVSSGNNDGFFLSNYGNFYCDIAGTRTADTGIAANDGNWHHIAATWQSSDGAFKLYKDGVEAFSQTVAQGASMPGGGSFVLGQEQDALGGEFSSSHAFAGLIDEVMIWSVARTPDEIRTDMDGDVIVADQLVLYWQFEQVGESAAADRVGRHDGALVDASPEAWVADGHPEVTRGVWNPTHTYPVAGKHEVGLKVRAESGRWSSTTTAAVTAIEGKIAGHVRAADLRTPVREVRVSLNSSHVEREALARAAAADTTLRTTAEGGLWALTDQNGYYEFQHLPLGSYRLRSNKGEGDRAHEFEQSVMATELTLNGPNQLAIDFVDLSVFPVGGRVVYSIQKNAQDVFENGVTLTAQPVGSTSAIEGLPSTRSLSVTGTNYSLPLFAGRYLMLAKKGDHDIRIRETTPGYDEGNGLVTIEDARTDVDFVDHTTRTLTVQVVDSGENPVAHYPVHFSNAGETIAVTVSGNNGQVSDAAVSEGEDDAVGLSVTLNPGRYTVRIPGAEPEEKEVDLTGGNGTVTMTIPVKIEVVLSASPRLLDVTEEFLAQFGLAEVDNPEGYMYYYPPEPRIHTYTVRATANSHPVEEFSLLVTDGVSMMSKDPPEEQEHRAQADSLDYVMTAGLPKRTEDDPPLAAPKQITFQITREGYEDSDTVTDSIIVLGDVEVGTAARTVSIPIVNYTVLHDPPGDGSYAFLDDALNISGMVLGMQIRIRDREIPVYPSPWRTERWVFGHHFAGSLGGDPDSDTNFRDMEDKGLLGYRNSVPTLAAFSLAARLEGLTGAAIVALGPVGYVLQLAQVGIKAAAITAAGTFGAVQYEVSPARRLETPSGDEMPDLLGPGKGDIYFGEGWTLGLQTKYRLGLERDSTETEPTWRLTTEQVETYDILDRTNQYVYSTRDIENIIDDLDRTIADPETGENEAAKLGGARDTWQGLLDANLSYVWQRDYVAQGLPFDDFLDDDGSSLSRDETETLIFSAGPAFEYSRTISTSSMVEFSSEVGLETSSEFSHEVEIKAGFVAWGTGTEMNLASGSAASIASGTGYGAAWESGGASEQSVGFVLNDDDVGDNITTRVYADPQWGTPIFFQGDGSYTSDPWEPGTNKNVDIILELITEQTGVHDYHDGAHRKVKITYAGQRELEASGVGFTLYASPTDNAGSVTVRFNGNEGPYGVELSKEAPSATVAVSVYAPERDMGSSQQRVYGAPIAVEEDEDSQIGRELSFDVTFADLRAPRAAVVSPYSGQRISPVFFPIESPIEVLAVTEDADAARVQLQIRSRQPDGVWEPWRNLTGLVWEDGADNEGVSVLDRLDRQPPRRELTFDWEESSIRALGVGEYALRAVATDRATPDANTDIDPPTVVFLVDEAKPSVLTTLPDYRARDSERMYRGELSVTFTDDMRPTDFDDRTMQVTDLLDDRRNVPGYVSYSPALRKVVFVPVVPFQPNGFYRVQVKTDEDSDGNDIVDVRGVHDLAGNPLDNAFTWTFRTTEAPFEPTWAMVWSVTDGTASDGNKIAAVEYGALEGEDERDALAVPGLASRLQLSFVDREQQAYERDIRPADGRLSHHWFMVVDNGAPGARVTLRWQPSIRLTKTTRDYQVIRLVEFGASGQVVNTVALDPTEARVDPETGLIDPVMAYTYTSAGEASRYFRLDVQRVGSVAQRLTVGTSGWKFLSVPITPQRSEPFVNLGDDIDPFRLYQYDGDIAGYRIYPFDLGYVSLVPGKGYFTRLLENVDVDVGGSSNHSDMALSLARPGWHAIGNPFLLDVAVRDLQLNGRPFDAAVSDGLVEGNLYRWDTPTPEDAFLVDEPSSDRYAPVASGGHLEPWKGYWMRTWKPGVELTIPAPGGIEQAQPPTPEYLQPPLAKPTLAGVRPGPGEFELALELRSAGSSDVTTSLGARSGASVGRDALDASEPPIPGGTVAAYFSQAEWGEASGQYNTDFRPPLGVGEARTWTVTALAAGDDAAELSWSQSIQYVPGDIVLYYRPLDQVGECDSCGPEWLDMRAVTGVSLVPSRLTVARYEVRAERIGLLAPQAVELEAGEERVTLRWQPDGREEVTGYVIRRHPGLVSDWSWDRAECIDLEQTPGAPAAEFVDTEVAGGAPYTYEVSARYRSGAEAAAPLQSVTTVAAVERTCLLQSFPNPANPELWIPYELERESAVRIDIFNAAGQLVRTLSVGVQPRGRYEGAGEAAYWDGLSDAGTPVSSGMYLYRLVAGPYLETRRLVLLR